jgi:selenide,water dikinase
LFLKISPPEGIEAQYPFRGEGGVLSFPTVGGCACKVGPGILEEILRDLPRTVHPDLLVGRETRDDCAVFRLSEDCALLFTCDFFPPVVEDPYLFGKIAALNALSDIYAMGGDPVMALYIFAFPVQSLPMEVGEKILKGAEDVLISHQCLPVGGHSLALSEVIFGLSVLGRSHPEEIFRNNGVKEGDLLFLTKPLGVGIYLSGYKKGMISPDDLSQAIYWMGISNRSASYCLRSCRRWVHGVTDVTGFGLLGHLKEMLLGTGCSAEIFLSKVPVLPLAEKLCAKGIFPQGVFRNEEYVLSFLPGPLSLDGRVLLDPQTNGGLLFSVEEEGREKIHDTFREALVPIWEIGRIVKREREGFYFLP